MNIAPRHIKISFIHLTFLLAISACHHRNTVKDPLFQVMDHDVTGVEFSNTLHPTSQFNVFDYMYFYNGGGVGAGDFNNDGRIDLFFVANQGPSRLYLNEGNFKFRDVTDEAKIASDSGWSTGVSVIDINNDGLLDIYICKVGQLDGLPRSHNQLLVCQGIDKNGVPTYEDKAKEYGLDFSGFSTQAVFFDYDGDGDLDMYLLNHSIHQNGTFGTRQRKLATSNPYSGDHLYRNDGNGHFTDVTHEAGINSSVIGYGLGINVSDIDLDGWPDIYVGNDFHENDYLYINQRNGTFRDELDDRIMHTSQFSMGVDVADINNDGFPEIISMDMLPYDPYILKRSLGEDTWDTYFEKIGYGYNYQYTRNNLQYNRRNGHFSETGLYSGIAATDWSWSPLWIDFDNDGRKDLFISNGIPKRLNDIDYINFVSNHELQQKMRDNDLTDRDMELIDRFPKIKLPSKFYENTGALRFRDVGDEVDGARPAYSNGAAYADLDGDGDMDIIVNNIDDYAMLYRNTSNDAQKRPYIDISLKGPEKNINALGAKLILFTGKEIRTYEKYPVHGFMSSMEIPVHIGLDHTQVDSLFLVWPDNTYQRVDLPQAAASQQSPAQTSPPQTRPAQTNLHIQYHPGLPRFDYSLLTAHYKNPTKPMEDITSGSGLNFKHEENNFHEFDREPLLPHMLSTEGPALAVADINHDGLQDIFVGSSKWKKSAIFIQQRSGGFIRSSQPALDADSTYEDVAACWTDVDHDGNPDLVIAAGGNEYFGNDTILTPRIYLGDGKGHFARDPHAIENIFVNASSITAADFNGDGAVDLFIGGRSVPWQYGVVPRSYLLLNDGKGRFSDATDQFAPGLSNIGFVTSAQWFDLDKDGQPDLLLTLEWGGIIAFMNDHGHFTKRMLSDKKGWWNFVLPVDLNGDGNVDLVAGNLGLNSRLKASDTQPVKLYYYDFDNNGKKDLLLTYWLDGRELPFANKEELEKQMPSLRKNFLYAENFAKASLQDLFSREKLAKADTFRADYFDNAIFINTGNLHFRAQAMPWEAQLSSFRDAVVVDANGDSLPDLLLVGNYYDNNIQMGRYDADYGTLLLNEGKFDGKDSFAVAPLNGLAIRGQVRHIQKIQIGGHESFILAKNNDSARLIRFSSPLAKPLSNPRR